MAIQFLLIVAFALAVMNIWRRERTGQLGRLAAVAWTSVWLAAGLVVALPETASWLAGLLGVGRGADAVTYLAVALLYFLVFRVVIAQRRLESDISRLVRELALRDMPKTQMPDDADKK